MFNNRSSNIFSNIPPATLHLIIINVLLFVVGMLVPKLGTLFDTKFALYYWGSGMFQPWQMVTYMFLHGSFTHLFFNMFALFMFGRMLEMVWGTKRFVIYYLICGIGAGLVQEVVTMVELHHLQSLLSPEALDEILKDGASLIRKGLSYQDPDMMRYHLTMCTPCVGASGAIFGILMGFAFLFPNLPMYIWFIPIPIKAKWMVLGYGVLELVFGVSGLQSGVAHFAHLGGLLFGLIVMFAWYGPGLFKGGARRM